MISTSIFCFTNIAHGMNLVTLNYKPLQYHDQNKVLTGPVPQLVCAIFLSKQENCNVELLPWPRSLRMVKDGKVEAIFTAFKTPEREQFLVYTQEPIIMQDIFLYSLSTSNISIKNDLSNLDQFRIGITSSISYGDKFDALIKTRNLTVDRADDLDSTIRKLIHGRIDVLISNRFAIENALKKPEYSGKLKRATGVIQSMPSYLAFSKKFKDAYSWAKTFDEGLIKLKKNGQYDRIFAKFNVDPR